MIYIREAHPTDGWAFKGNVKVKDPSKIEERRKVAKVCVNALKLKCSILVDDMNDTVNMAYTAMPERLAVVDKNGKMAYISGQGPWGFKPDEFKKFLKKHLSDKKNCKE